MKAFLCAAIVMVGIAFGADYLLGGPVFETGGILIQSSSADAFTSSNVRLD